MPSICELIRRDGDADKGRAVFFRAGTNSCSSCHRVQGRGQWVGPDLSTIGVKYGHDELIRSILSPSAAIGVSFRSLVVALADGRVITGLPVEDTPDRLVVKTADGQRIAVEPRSVEDRRTSDVSLMPEGLAQTMTDQELVDLLAYLTTLRQPVSIVGEYQVIGPLHEPDGTPLVDPASKLDLAGARRRRPGPPALLAASERERRRTGRLDAPGRRRPEACRVCLGPGGLADRAAGHARPRHAGRDRWSGSMASRWHSPAKSQDKNEPRTAVVDLPEGASTLLIRVAAGGRSDAQASLVTTFVADRPVGFDAGAVGPSASAAKQP